MAPRIQAFKVYDPALEDQVVDEPVRVHIALDNFPSDPTHVDLDTGPFTISHYGKYMKIFSDLPEWDDEDTQAIAARFNNHFTTSELEPVIPITVVLSDAKSAMREVDRAMPYSAEDYFVKVSTMKKLLAYGQATFYDSDTCRWDVQPKYTSAVNKRHTWEIRDLNDRCIHCGRQGTQVNMIERSVPLCETHHSEHQEFMRNLARASG